MPKKGKKGKKGDKKGGKKVKDEAKDESIAKMAERNSNIWEAKLKMTEFHKEHYKDTARQLVEENTSLVDYMKETEKDTIDVVTYLRKLDAEKDDEVSRLTDDLKTIDSRYQKEKTSILSDFHLQITDLHSQLDSKTLEATLLENELNQLKEFRKKKLQMQRELEEIKEAMLVNERDHSDHMTKIEEKFFEEKMRLQIEANKKIEQLAEKAHDAAIQNLDDITRNIYKENVQLTESFRLNTGEIEILRKENKNLRNHNEKLFGQTEDNINLAQEKVSVASKQAVQIKDFKIKVEILEKSLSQVVREFEVERTNIIRMCRTEMDSSVIELEKTKRTLALRNKEMNRVKKLAKNILEQRSELERFFLDSLDFVKKEIATNRNEYRREANALYNNRMLAAHAGQIEYPKVRTFTKKFDAASTNNVFKDLEQAEKWFNLNNMVDLVDLTWEQKEQVLRELFSRMNGPKKQKDKEIQKKANLAISAYNDDFNDTDEDEPESNTDETKSKNSSSKSLKVLKKVNNNEANADFTFLTQSSVEATSPFHDKSLRTLPKLPSIDSLQKS